MIIPQIPAATPSEIGNWLISAAAVLSIAALVKRITTRKPASDGEFVTKAEFRPFRLGVEREFSAVRDRVDARFLSLGEKIEQLRSDLLKDAERRSDSLHRRINELDANVARLDERTR